MKPNLIREGEIKRTDMVFVDKKGIRPGKFNHFRIYPNGQDSPSIYLSDGNVTQGCDVRRVLILGLGHRGIVQVNESPVSKDLFPGDWRVKTSGSGK